LTIPWDGIVPSDEQKIYEAAGFGRRAGFGRKPALLIIDVQNRSIGTSPRPIHEAIKEYPTSCGEIGWAAVEHIAGILKDFRARGWPVIYPFVSPKESFDKGRISDRVPSVMGIQRRGYDFVEKVAPVEGDILLPKKHPSAFFGTPLASYLIEAGVDKLVVTGVTTSGCIRATVIDAFSYNFRAVVPHEAVYDRSQISHAVNLFDMAAKYADVVSVAELRGQLKKID
jgi:nicotinamidase-related amidase